VIRQGRPHTGTGISTRCPSTTPVGLALGPDSPWADWPAPGTLGLSAGKVLTCLIATHACILTRVGSTAGLHRDFTAHTTLPYHSRRLNQPNKWAAWQISEIHNFGGVLEPRYIVGAESLDQ
jgi:hypothetical protein